jgi:hypothetical protein
LPEIVYASNRKTKAKDEKKRKREDEEAKIAAVEEILRSLQITPEEKAKLADPESRRSGNKSIKLQRSG